MFNCSKEITSYHNDEVTLPQAERSEMRDRRNSNRDRVKKGLENNNDPLVEDFASQGSYAMKTMVQHKTKGYDIDDGVYFAKEDLKGKSSLQARQMVRNAVDDGGFKTAPEVRKNCVRVYYEKGYHVDLPVYRRVEERDIFGNTTEFYELASSEWKRSDARDVTDWFDKENRQQSLDKDNGRQLRRIIRFIKKFSQSRDSWKGRIGSGFMITKLVTEKFVSNAGREDTSLYDTMKAIRDRLETNLVVKHPVTPDSTITAGDADPKAKFLKEKLSEAIVELEVLFEAECDREKALKAWDKVFNTSFFTDTIKKDGGKNEAATAGGLLSSGYSSPSSAVKKDGGGRYA
jgi:hypothetical protein